MLNLFRFITLFSGSTLIALGGFIYSKNRVSMIHKVFGSYLLFCGLWSLGFFLTMFQTFPYEFAIWASRISHFFGGMTAFLFMGFVNEFLKPEIRHRIHPIHIMLGAGTGFVSLTPWMIIAVPKKLFFPYYPEPGLLYPVLLASFFYTYSVTFWWLYQAYRNQALEHSKRMQCLLTLLGVLLAWASVATLFLPIYHIYITPQMTLFPVLFFATIYSIIRYRFLDIRVVVTRAGLLLGIYLIVLGIPFVFAWKAKHQLMESFGENWWLVPLGLCTALATAGPFAYAYLRRQAEDRLLREQRRYQRTLQRAARGMTQVRDVTKLSQLITRIVSRSVRVTHASLFLWDKPHRRYVLRSSHGTHRLALQSRYVLEASHPLIRWLIEHRRALLNEDAVDRLESPIREELESLGAVLVVPGLIERHLVGFLVLGPKLSGASYSSDDLHAFATLANEAAMAIENATSYEELLKVNEQLKAASERLLLQERLVAAGQFAMGMAHEVKNPLSAIKTFAQYLPEKYADPKFREKFFRIVQSEIDRINTLVKELSDFAKPAPLELQPTHLASLVEDTLSLLSTQCLKQDVQVQKVFHEDGLQIAADPQQLKQVILNLFLNSLDAMPSGGRLEVSTKLDGSHLVLRVVDTGCGISSDHLADIWDPFFTTKERGMGLSLAIVKGVVERHGGRITFSSVLGKGTTVDVLLPVQLQDPTLPNR